MNSGALKVFQSVRTFSTTCIFIGIVLSLVLRPLLGSSSLGWQVVIATFALAVGIPHGAVDHLIAMRSTSKIKMVIIILLYVLTAVLAAISIFTWNVWGFELVLLMSALHFGFGDAAYINELDRLSGLTRLRKPTQILYALASGSLPVLIPLTQSSSKSALEQVNPKLIDWAGNFEMQLRLLVLLLTVAAVLFLIYDKRYREILDLVLLGILSVFAPPLVAFAMYFGCWHAIRHTARLTLLLPKSISFALLNSPVKSFRAAVIPGIPALILTLVVSLIILISKHDLSANYFWTLLVVVWALTVPHMAVTARIDKKALN